MSKHIKMADMKRARLDDAQEGAKEKSSEDQKKLNVDQNKQGGEEIILYEDMSNILIDFGVDEFIHSDTPLLVTPIMTTLLGKLEVSIQRNQYCKTLLQGPSGVGKTTTLLYIGHMARKKGYIVFPIQASDFVNQARPMSMLIQEFLRSWVGAVGQHVVEEIVGHDYFGSMEKILSKRSLSFDEESKIIELFPVLVKELQSYQAKPVVFLVDQCSAFTTKKQMLKLYSGYDMKKVSPEENPVGAMFLDWNIFKVKCGGVFYGFSSSTFQLMPTAHDGNYRLILPLKPMNDEEFKKFIVFLIHQNRLPPEFESTHFQDFFQLSGGMPREAFVFADVLFGDFSSKTIVKTADYQQWKALYMNARTPFYKTRIQRLLDKETLGPTLLKESVPFAARLFKGENMTAAPDVWIASGLIKMKDGFQKLLCPAAEKALMLVFEEDNAGRRAIEIVRSDLQIR